MKHIIGIGNALTDALVRIENDSVLDTLSLPKGSMQLIDEHRLPAIRTMMGTMNVGYGPEGYVVMRGNCYWIHKANGCNAMPPMIPYNFEKKKWDMHDSYLRIMC